MENESVKALKENYEALINDAKSKGEDYYHLWKLTLSMGNEIQELSEDLRFAENEVEVLVNENKALREEIEDLKKIIGQLMNNTEEELMITL